MRKVKFKMWIPKEHVNGDRHITIAGTGCFQADYLTTGVFHQWGCSYEEFESGPGNFTVAIVETKDGVIHEVLPTNLKFIN
jgi:hypothetical protein